MANYYTYGMVPDVDETVYGTSVSYGGLGNPEYVEPSSSEEPVAVNRGLPEEEPVGPSPLGEYNAPQPMPESKSDQPAAPYIPPGLEAAFLRMQGKSPEQLAAKEAAAAQTKPQREVLSDLLKNNQFDAAFKYAKDNNIQNLLIDPNELKTLRGPFSNDEMKSFFSAMPKDLMGEQDERAVKFTPDKALEQSLQVAQIPKEGAALGPLGELIGYPDVQKAFEPQELVKEMTPFDKLIRAAVIGGVAYAGGTALAGLGGAGGAGAAGAGSGGGGLSGAIKAVGSIPAKIGGTIAETLGLPVTSTVGKAALGNAVITGGTTAAKGGSLEDVLKAGLLSAGLTYVSAPVMDGLKDAAKAVGGKLGIGTGAAGTAAGQAATEALSNVAVDDLLQQVTVTASRPALSNLIGLGAVAVPTRTKVDLPEPKVATEQVAPEVEEPPLEEIVVTSQRPPLSDLLGLGTVAVPTTTPVTTPRPSVLEPEPVVADREIPEQAVEEQPLEEVTVTAQRPPLSDLLGLGAVAIPTTTPVDIQKPDYIEDVVLPEEEPLDEVVVTGQRPPLSDLLGLGAVAVPTTTPITLPEPKVVDGRIEYPEEDLEEVVVRTTPTPESGLNIPPIAIPTTTKVDLPKPKINEPNPLKDMLEKYGSLENLLKLLGALGSAGSGGTGGGTAPTTGGGMGGALPKYTYTRQQLSPDIDYYTYGTRPEAKFFEYGTQLEKPVQPELPSAKPPGEDVPMATGGLTGYAKGGSKSLRYVDGPGSGREDKIPALLSDGEYVIDAETLALLGDGSTKEGARRMDAFRANIRKHKGRALSRGRISPDAKSPSKYMGGGLT